MMRRPLQEAAGLHDQEGTSVSERIPTSGGHQ